MKNILRILPEPVQHVIHSMPGNEREDIEEIRLRIGHPVELIVRGEPWEQVSGERLPLFQMKDAGDVLQKISRHSLYTLEEELKRGYVTITGGHRIGLAGRVITEHGQVKRIRDIGSFNIRIAKQKIGVAVPLVPILYENDRWRSALIIGAPQAGKTTILRDVARLVSEGVEKMRIPSKKVGIVDERSEIAGCVKGVPQNRLGNRVDVLDACPKAEGMMMMIRSMSPDVLIVDEIGRKEDSDALQEAMNAGVSVIATVHGRDFQQIIKRPFLKPLIETQIFERFIELPNRKSDWHSKRTIHIRNEQGGLLKQAGGMVR